MGAGVETELSQVAGPTGWSASPTSTASSAAGGSSQREAIFAGGSSGGVAAAIEQLSAELPTGSRCAPILADGGEGYLDTVYDDDWVAGRLGRSLDKLGNVVCRDRFADPEPEPAPA